MAKPKGEFVCTDCRQSFETGKEFSDHFKRGAGGIEIVGCKSLAELKAEAKPAQTRPRKGLDIARSFGPADRGAVAL